MPDVEQMSVIEVEEPEFDAEYKEQIAKRLFDNEEMRHSLFRFGIPFLSMQLMVP